MKYDYNNEDHLKELFDSAKVQEVPDQIWEVVHRRINRPSALDILQRFHMPDYVFTGIFCMLLILSVVILPKKRGYVNDSSLIVYEEYIIDDDLMITDIGSDIETYFL